MRLPDADWISEDETIVLYNRDCLSVLPTLAGGSVDAVVTDPPYGIARGKGQINKARGKGFYSDAFDDSPAYVRNVVVPVIESLRNMCGCVVLTPGNKNMCAYPQPDSFGCFYQPAASGLQVFGNVDAQPIFYYGRNRNPNMGKRLSWQVTEPPATNEHPCAKPQKAWKVLLCSVTRRGDTVLDPFMGSGTTGVACIQTGRKFIGIEIDEGYFEIAKRRIQEAQMQPVLL